MSKYLNNDIYNPNYLYHGSPKKLEVIEQRQAHDSDGVKENEDYAVFMTSSFIVASAYAFKDRIKEMSQDLQYEFEIGRNPETDEIFVIMDNVNIDDELEGYVYVFDFDSTYEHEERSIQYKCHKNVTPIDVIPVRFKDYKQFYTINQSQENMKQSPHK